MEKKVLKLKPHHVEGAIRFAVWGKNEGHKEMLKLIQDAYNKNPEAEMIFVKGYDDFCEKCCIQKGQIPECVFEHGTIDEFESSKEQPVTEKFSSVKIGQEMDETVAREHGWEFDKPYKVKNILEQIEREAPKRNRFYVTARIAREDFEKWLEDVRKSKGKN